MKWFSKISPFESSDTKTQGSRWRIFQRLAIFLVCGAGLVAIIFAIVITPDQIRSIPEPRIGRDLIGLPIILSDGADTNRTSIGAIGDKGFAFEDCSGGREMKRSKSRRLCIEDVDAVFGKIGICFYAIG